MKTESEHIDLFESYLMGELSMEEVSDFEEKLVSDSDFKLIFEEYKSLKIGLKKHFREELKSKFSDIDNRLDSPKKKEFRIHRWFVSSVAAMLVIGLFVFNNQSNSSSDLVAKYWPYEAGLPVRMSEENKYDDAMNAFKLEEWGKAEALLKSIDSDTSNYYLGVVNYELKDFATSLDYFNQIDANSSFYEEARFRLALIYILQDDLDLANEILAIQIKKETIFSTEAKEVLEEME